MCRAPFPPCLPPQVPTIPWRCLPTPASKHLRRKTGTCIPPRGPPQRWPRGQRGRVSRSPRSTGAGCPNTCPAWVSGQGHPRGEPSQGRAGSQRSLRRSIGADLRDVLQTCFPLVSAQGHKLDSCFSYAYWFYLSFSSKINETLACIKEHPENGLHL